MLTAYSQLRKLDDSELDSEDDEGRKGRLADTIEEDEDGLDLEESQQKIALAEISRIKPPEADEVDGIEFWRRDLR